MVKKGDLINFSEFGFDESGFPRTFSFLGSQNPTYGERMKSRWRKTNLILKVGCEWQDYVVKKINDSEKGEIDKVIAMKRVYPAITPRLFLVEGSDCYTMDYIHGQSFFDLSSNERVKRISFAGKLLSNAYLDVDGIKVDVSRQVRSGFERYRKTRKEFFDDNELDVSDINFEIFRSVSNQLSHNDLNAANLLYSSSINVIDPTEEGYNDVGRDVGRYCASCFFNNYDYFGNDIEHSLAIARAFLDEFDEDVLRRAQYYIGESFLSFLKFDTVTTEKKILKNLAMRVLTGNENVLDLMQEGLVL